MSQEAVQQITNILFETFLQVIEPGDCREVAEEIMAAGISTPSEVDLILSASPLSIVTGRKRDEAVDKIMRDVINQILEGRYQAVLD